MKIILFTVLALAIFNAQAQDLSINVETRYGTKTQSGTGEQFAQNLLSEWESAPAETYSGQYGQKTNPTFPFSNQSLFGSSSNILWKLEFNFYQAEETDWLIEFGTDFNRGAAIFIDGQFDSARTHDFWWDGKWYGNWDNRAVFKFDQTLQPGQHTILVHGSEGCCDGNIDDYGINVRFSVNGGDKQVLSVENVTTEVPSGPSRDCVILFDQCEYQGNQLEVCESNPDTTNFSVKSIYVPENTTATLFNELTWEGQQAEFTESVNCMELPDFQDAQFLELHKITMVKKSTQVTHHKKHLRTNSHK